VSAFLATVLALAVWASPARAGQAFIELFRFQDPEIRESSGVAVSSRDEEVIFTHNDSGDVARFFAVDAQGCTLGRYTLEDADAIDWEDMAGGTEHRGKPTLWFGDIGDNAANRPSIVVYRVVEPKVAVPAGERGGCPVPVDRQLATTRFELRYADGARDAETLLVHPRSGRLFVVSKASAQLYAAPRRLSADEVNVLDPVASTDAPGGLVTAGDISRSGKRLVLRDYSEAFEWRIRDGDVAAALATPPLRLALPPTPQGEAIAYTRSGGAVVTTSEDPGGSHPPAYRVAVERGS
jgi:hypothetical protein